MPAKKEIVSPILEKTYKMPKLQGEFFSAKKNAELIPESWKVVYFYPKDLTSGCTVEANDFEAASKEFKKLGCEIVGVSKDSCASHEKFASKEGLNFMLLSDTDGKTCEAFGVWIEKSMYGRKYMGIERSTFLVNPKGHVCAQWNGVKVPGHVDAVLQTLKELLKQ